MVRIIDNDSTIEGQLQIDDVVEETESNKETYERLGKLQGEYEHLVIEDAQAKELVNSATQNINDAMARLAWLEHCSGGFSPAAGAASLDKSRETYQSEDCAP
jgi:hypothetical protein